MSLARPLEQHNLPFKSVINIDGRDVIFSIDAQHLLSFKSLLIQHKIPFQQVEVQKEAPTQFDIRSLMNNGIITAKLSAREIDVLEQLINGLEYQQIADKLFISLETVRSHIKNIFRKFDVNSRSEVTAKLLQLR